VNNVSRHKIFLTFPTVHSSLTFGTDQGALY